MSAPDEAITDDGYDMVLRFRPKGPEQRDLARAVPGILTERTLRPLLDKDTTFDLRVLQPVVGSAPSVWEVRLNVPDLSQLGRVLDWAGEPRPEGTVLGRLSNVPGFDVMGKGVPLFRAWRIP